MADFSQALGDDPSSETRAADKPTSGAAAAGNQADAAMRKEFDNLDKDKSGFIDKGDIKKLCSFVPDSLIVKAISFVDKNKDGKISFEEYKEVRNQITKLTGKK
jgi:hypothetical protein